MRKIIARWKCLAGRNYRKSAGVEVFNICRLGKRSIRLVRIGISLALLISLCLFPVACKPNPGSSQQVDKGETAGTESSDPESGDPKAEIQAEPEYDPLDMSLVALGEDSYQLIWPEELSFYEPAVSPEAKFFQAMLFAAPLRQVRLESGFDYLPELLSKLPELSPDGLSADLYFRDQAIVPDGPVVRAEDYAQYLKNMLSAKRHNPIALEIIQELPLVGAEAYYRGAIRNNTDPAKLAELRQQLRSDLLSYNQDKELGQRLGWGFLSQDEISEPDQADSKSDSDQTLDQDSDQAETDQEAEPEASPSTTAEAEEAEDTDTEDTDTAEAEDTEETDDTVVDEQDLRQELQERLADYLLKEARNMGVNMSQRTYDSLPKKRPYWASVGVSLISLEEKNEQDNADSDEQGESDQEASDQEASDQVELADQQTVVRLEFSRPVTKLKLYQALSQYGPMVYKSGFSQECAEDLLDYKENQRDWTQILSSLTYQLGPYKLLQVTDKSLVLQKQADHLNSETSHDEYIHLRRFNQLDEAVQAYNSGLLDEFRFRGKYKLDQASKQIYAEPGSTWCLYINRQPQPGKEFIANKLFRQALASSIKRKDLIQGPLANYKPATTLVGKAVRDPFDWQRAYVDSYEAKGNIAPNAGLNLLEAKNSFVQLGSNYGISKLEFNLMCPANRPELKVLAEELSAQWQSFFGDQEIKLNLQELDQDNYLWQMALGNYDLALAPFDLDPYDPLARFASYAELGLDNLTAYQDQNYTQLYADMRAREGLLTKLEWRSGLAKLEQLLLEDKSIVPLFTAFDYVAYGPSFEPARVYLPYMGFRDN